MRKIYVWGTGCEAEKCISEINTENCQIKGYIETMPTKKKWKSMPVYASESLFDLKYDYIIIANTYYDEILNDIREKKLADESKIVNWIKIRECIYHYPEEVWELFSENFLKDNFYIFNSDNRNDRQCLPKRIYKYKKIYIYDLRLVNNELDIGMLFYQIINNSKRQDIGMAFIPDEEYQDENWYHNLLYVLERNALVIWKDLEGAYVKYIKDDPEKFSFIRFGILQFVREEKRCVHKGKYMMFDAKLVYNEKRDFISMAKAIKIRHLRCDRIGEEIRVLNRILIENDEEKDIFKLYIPIDAFSRPFEGTNTCFNELISRRLNLLRNKEEYALWVQDIFEKSEKYEYDRAYSLLEVRNFKCGTREMYQPFIDFYDDELVFGRKLISDRLGVIGDYVCLFTRDEEYLKKTLPGFDASYHNYRDSSFDIMNKAIDYFDSCNIQTIRMGQITEKKEVYEKCIDFAEQGYDEFLDLIIHRYCKFFIGTASGVSEIPNIFGRPVVWLFSCYPSIEFSIFYVRGDLCIFNRIFNIAEGRELSFSEIFDMSIDFRSSLNGEYFVQHGLSLIPVSEDDILDVAVEMNDKLDGVWKPQKEDALLHNDFNLKLKAAIEKHNIDVSNIVPLPVATSFLRKYKYLLEDEND